MIAVAGPSVYWYLARGTGAVTLLLLTVSVVLGILHADRRRPAGAPRLLVESAHRTVSLLVVAMVAIHVVVVVLDSFAPVRLTDAVLPFTSAYRPLWVGFGAVAFDLLLALAVTSLLRARLGFRAWRGVHWLAYACWPVAVLHGAGTGSDAKSAWMLAFTVACIAAVLAAIGTRLVSAGPGHGTVRAGALGLTVAATAAFAAWLPQGPLARGWALRAGTPAKLLAFSSPVATPARQRVVVAQPPPARAFTASVAGVAHQGFSSGGVAVVDLALRLHSGSLRVRLAGQPAAGGGVSLSTSAVTLTRGGVYQGRIASLNGTDVRALVAAPDGRALRLDIQLQLNGASVTGRVVAQPLTGSA